MDELLPPVQCQYPPRHPYPGRGSDGQYEAARERIAAFINAPSARQVIFTRNTTESINLVAYTWGRANLNAGDTVILTEMEHHSNLVPWHMLAAETRTCSWSLSR
jgi:cysteine desulfurase / selenocysteine lyase